MKLFPVRGGIHPEYRKERSSESAIVALPLPALLYLPLQQHIGAAAEPVVHEGDIVGKGQLLARAAGTVSAPVHAPTSGRIVSISDLPAPHPSGLPQPTIILEPDGLETWASLPEPMADPFTATPAEICARVSAAGIVGLGGATFPSAVKLNLGSQNKLETLAINGAECEPYLTCDDRLMREYAAEIIDGARIMARALGTPKIVIGIENNKPQALEIVTKACAAYPETSVVALPVQYPMGSERHLAQALTGKEAPAKGLTAAFGVVVHNVATARAVHHAVRFGRPLVSRVVTVSGGAVREPHNIEAPLGAKVSDLLAFCGGLTQPPHRIISGGPMMGSPLPNLDVPVVKGTSGILALTALEANEHPSQPCIRCGACVTICPCGLVPVEMAAFIRRDNLEAAAKIGVTDCFSCGSCSYLCPSHIPLVHYFNFAKGALAQMDRDKRKTEKTRTLVDAHNDRLEKQVAARKAAAAASAAARAAAQSADSKGTP